MNTPTHIETTTDLRQVVLALEDPILGEAALARLEGFGDGLLEALMDQVRFTPSYEAIMGRLTRALPVFMLDHPELWIHPGLTTSSRVTGCQLLGEMVKASPTETRKERCWSLLLEQRGGAVALHVAVLRNVLDSPIAVDLLIQALEASESAVRACAYQLLGTIGDEASVDALTKALTGRPWEGAEALSAFEAISPELARRVVREYIAKLEGPALIKAAQILADGGDAEDAPVIARRLTGSTDEVRAAILRSLGRLDVTMALERARWFANAADKALRDAALDVLGAGLDDEALYTLLLSVMHGGDAAAAIDIVRRMLTLSPSRIEATLEAAMSSRDIAALQSLVPLIVECGGAELRARLEAMMALEKGGGARAAAFEALIDVCGAPREEMVERHIQDPHWQVRLSAVKALDDVHDVSFLDMLLDAVRDEDEDVREAALWNLVPHDDPRVYSELVSSLHDLEENVRQLADEVLNGVHGHVPVLADGRGEGMFGWELMRDRIDRINAWASAMGEELLGKSVRVFQYRQGLGRTHGGKWTQEYIEIEVSDTPVTSGHPYGEQIMKGLALHEIGHHLCDIGVRGHRTMRGIARSLRIKDIYDILIDERLERTLRSRRPEWGIYFDRLASYAFAQRTHRVPLSEVAHLLGRELADVAQAVEVGELPGELGLPRGREREPVILLKDAELLRLEGAVSLIAGFLWCLRCGFSPTLHPDARVAEAVAMVGPELRQMNHAGVLDLTRRIAALLEHQDTERGSKTAKAPSRGACGINLPSAARQVQRGLDSAKMLPESQRPEKPEIRKDREPQKLDPNAKKGAGGWTLNLGPTVEYPPLHHVEKLIASSADEGELVGSIRKHIRRLRPYFERLGHRVTEEHAMRRGRRLDMARARRAALIPSLNVLVHHKLEVHPNAYVGVLIDCSGSMAGDRIALAKRFGALVAESLCGLRGIEGHVQGFDDTVLYDAGDFQRHAISGLVARGGNNDAAALEFAARRALASCKRNRLLLMISDGSPSSCTVAALRALVARLTHHHEIVCAQVAVAPISHAAFEHGVDLSAYGMEEAVARFGRLVVSMTKGW